MPSAPGRPVVPSQATLATPYTAVPHSDWPQRLGAAVVLQAMRDAANEGVPAGVQREARTWLAGGWALDTWAALAGLSAPAVARWAKGREQWTAVGDGAGVESPEKLL